MRLIVTLCRSIRRRLPFRITFSPSLAIPGTGIAPSNAMNIQSILVSNIRDLGRQCWSLPVTIFGTMLLVANPAVAIQCNLGFGDRVNLEVKEAAYLTNGKIIRFPYHHNLQSNFLSAFPQVATKFEMMERDNLSPKAMEHLKELAIYFDLYHTARQFPESKAIKLELAQHMFFRNLLGLIEARSGSLSSSQGSVQATGFDLNSNGDGLENLKFQIIAHHLEKYVVDGRYPQFTIELFSSMAEAFSHSQKSPYLIELLKQWTDYTMPNLFVRLGTVKNIVGSSPPLKIELQNQIERIEKELKFESELEELPEAARDRNDRLLLELKSSNKLSSELSSLINSIYEISPLKLKKASIPKDQLYPRISSDTPLREIKISELTSKLQKHASSLIEQLRFQKSDSDLLSYDILESALDARDFPGSMASLGFSMTAAIREHFFVGSKPKRKPILSTTVHQSSKSTVLSQNSNDFYGVINEGIKNWTSETEIKVITARGNLVEVSFFRGNRETSTEAWFSSTSTIDDSEGILSFRVPRIAYSPFHHHSWYSQVNAPHQRPVERIQIVVLDPGNGRSTPPRVLETIVIDAK